MTTNHIRLLSFVALLISAFAFTACNTARGIGQDIEKAGQGLQKAADK